MAGYRLIILGQHIPEAHSSSTNPTTSSAEGSEGIPQNNADENMMKSRHDKTELVMEVDAIWHFPLYKSAMVGDWETGKQIILRHGSEALRARIRGYSETALHVAVGSGQETTHFVNELLQLLLPIDLEVTTGDGCTPLGIAAKVGNLEAAKMLVAKNPRLIYIPDGHGSLPIHIAAEYGQKEMLFYMLQVTKKGQYPDPYDPEGRGPELLRYIIKAEFYGIFPYFLSLLNEP